MDASVNHPRARILVVDDQELIRESFATALRAADLDVVVAATGTEALAATERQRIDVVLLDAHLPDMSGEVVLDRIRAHPDTGETPVVIVTGDPELDRKLAGLQRGANDYLIKPVTVEELVARVRAQIQVRDRWLGHMEDALDARRTLARRLTALDVDRPLSDLVAELRGILADAVGAADLTVDAEPSQAHAGPVLRYQRGRTVVQVPLVSAGTVYATVELTVERDPERALSTMLDVAPQVAAILHRPFLADMAVNEDQAAIDRVLQPGEILPVFQPIVSLPGHEVLGYEGLSRFLDGANPLHQFRRATRAGRGVELELAALDRLVAAARGLPAGAWVSLNVSVTTLTTADLLPHLAGADRRVVLEITEHELISDYDAVAGALGRLGDVGLAVDDAGSGYASLRHVYELRPELIKLDRDWITDIDDDPVRRALVAGLQSFAEELGATLLAEGVETAAERQVLLDLGITIAQGFRFGHPSPAAHWNGGSAP